VLQGRDLHTSTHRWRGWGLHPHFLLAASVAGSDRRATRRQCSAKESECSSYLPFAFLVTGSLLAALVATSLIVLIAARTIQGLGGAIYSAPGFGIIRG